MAPPPPDRRKPLPMTAHDAQTSPRDRSAAKSASRAAALVVAVLAMVVEIAPAVFLMAGGGSLATVLANAPAERVAPAVAPTAPGGHLQLVSDRAARRPVRLAPTATPDRPLAPGAAESIERLSLPPPALA